MSKAPSQLAAYADLFQQLQDCVLLLDPGSHLVLEANVACLQVLGLARDRVIGRPMVHWVETSSREDLTHALRSVARRRQTARFDARWQLEDNRIVVMDLSAAPIVLADRNEVLQIVARDVSFRREAEQLIQALKKQLEMALGQSGEQPVQPLVADVKLIDLLSHSRRKVSGE